MSELKPCPFCGSDDVSVLDDAGYLHGDRFPFTIACHDCGAYGSSERTARLAIEAWNMRTGCENCAALNKAAGLWAKADKRARDLERTCKDVSERPSRFKCSECGCVSLEYAAFFCPYCGAKVVN